MLALLSAPPAYVVPEETQPAAATTFAIVRPPDAPAVPRPPSRKTLRRQRQLAAAGLDPERNVLPMELRGVEYGHYRVKLVSRDPHCIYCGKELSSKESATLDHAIPVCQGGLDTPGNLWLCCSNCNRAKNNRSAVEWLIDLYRTCLTMGLVGEIEALEPATTEGGVA